ncbi:MAG: Crp/Fnr family transcriptional regulator [Blautia sp.]|nr:Crp/Fnr family transcriptional regulator [Blautia sp.]
MDDRWSLQNLFLESLSEPARERLLEVARVLRVNAGEYIFREGEKADDLYIIEEGQVKLSHIDAEGRENIVMFLSGSDTIWENLFLYQGTFPFSAVTMTKTKLYSISREKMLGILDEPQVAMQIIAMLSRKLHDANERAQILATKNPQARLARFFLYHLERGSTPLLLFHLEEIASSISLRIETVSRKITDLQRMDLIRRVGHGKILIVNPEGLKNLCQEE